MTSVDPYVEVIEGTEAQRRTFFKLLLGNSATGYICIAMKSHADGKVKQAFFNWPDQLNHMLAYIGKHQQEKQHVYFSPIIFSAKMRKVPYAKVCTSIWADLDFCHPRNLLIEPSIVIESSPNRFQAFWTLEEPVTPAEAEDIARRIAYYHKEQGADTSGWDLTQLLRVPYTLNYKYANLTKLPVVSILKAERKLYRINDFTAQYPQIRAVVNVTSKEMPEVAPLSENFLEKYPLLRDDERFNSLYYNAPTGADDWSERLWALELICFEAGLTDTEVFHIARTSACNKYARDGRPDETLWRDVTRARLYRIEQIKLVPTVTTEVPDFITDQEVEIVRNRETFVERYIHWASTVTDASPAYHQAGAFMSMSGILSGNLMLRTSFGKMRPNMWFMLLGDTTLTRKTTAVNMAMNLLNEIDEESMLASDGSIEGMFSALAERPGTPSVFLRDEFTGFVEGMMKKDYMAGFAEQLTKLYDGDRIKRLLRKETIDVKDPVFLMFVSGIKSKMQTIVTEELVNGGFIPRFVIICGEPDLSRVKDMGPPNDERDEARESLINELKDIYSHYAAEIEVTTQGNRIGGLNKCYEVKLTPAAWTRYNKFERAMTKLAIESGLPYLTPMYDRLSKSALKAAILIAATTQRSNEVIVDELDLVHAIFYARQWREHCSELINTIGRTNDERVMEAVTNFVRLGTSGTGVTRAEIMKRFGLDAKRSSELLKTLELRQDIFLDSGKYFVPY